MSYTNQTTHYGIPLPTQDDYVNGLDWNTSSEAVDTALYNAEQAATTSTAEIAAIKATMALLQDADVQFQSDLNETNGRVSTLEQNATKDEQDIQDIADMITDKEVAQAQSDVEVSQNEWFRYNGVLYVATQAIHVGDTIIPNTNCRATNIEDEMPTAGEVIDVTARAEIGTMANLNTTDKTSLVAAINEVLSQIGGGGMKCVKFEVISTSTAGDYTVDLTDLGFTDASDYTVILNGYINYSAGHYNPSVTAKTATSFTIGLADGTRPDSIRASVQVLA